VSGEGDPGHPLNNPPPLRGWNAFAWEFYIENATSFTKEFNLMPGLISEIKMDKTTKRLFLKKLDLIHRMWIDYWERESKLKNG
jgi:hypothetical protein